MVGILIVSHSERLAEGVAELARQMTGGKEVPVKGVGGLEDGSLGTSFDRVMAAMEEVLAAGEVLVLADLGSAVMTSQMCVEALPEEMRSRVALSSAPLVEGAVAAASAAAQGLPLEEVRRAAEGVKLDKGQEENPSPLEPSGRFVDVVLTNPSGLHARPAALLSQMASRFKARIWVKNLSEGKPPADAKSVLELALKATAERGQTIRIYADGEDAERALEELKGLVEGGFGEVERPGPSRKVPAETAEGPRSMVGKGVYPGFVVGPARRLRRDLRPEIEGTSDPEEEERRFERALESVIAETRRLRDSLAGRASEGVAAIFDFQAMVLSDEGLLRRIREGIRRGKGAARAASEALEGLAEEMESSSNPLMRERGADLRDLRRRFEMALSSPGSEGRGEPPPEGFVLIADELLPSEAASLDVRGVLGIATSRGGPTSHAAIIARSLGIPSVVGLGPDLLEVEDGTTVALDGSTGRLLVNPTREEIEALGGRRARAPLGFAEGLAATVDGRAVEVAANAGSLRDALEALERGADGIGLLRTEFLFVDRLEAPSEEEQARIYSEIARAMRGRPVVVRTLDVGGDKPLPYLPTKREENPFLGVRGIRLCRLHPEVFRAQLRAILRASAAGSVRVMFPMVSSLEEIEWAKEVLEECREELRARGAPFDPGLQVGTMVEVPSAAITSDLLAKGVDFFSVGTNDLTQYALACDRGNEALSHLYDHLHPAVLRLIQRTVEEAHRMGRWVGVCGEMAGDLEAVPLLVGLGVDELSVSPPLVPAVKELIRRSRFEELAELAREALTLSSPEEIKGLVRERCRALLEEFS